MAEPLIALDRAWLGYGPRTVLKDLTLEIAAGEFWGIVGPNGSGKTTLLRAILGSLPPQRGSVRLAGKLRFGYVPQRESLDLIYPLSAEEVVLMGRFDRIGLLRRPTHEDRDRVHQALVHVGIANLGKQLYRDLSGGQKQRCLIARALVGAPDVLVLDEPTNGMDLASQKAMLDLAAQLHAEAGLTVLMVSHLLNEVANYARNIALVEERFFQAGPVEKVLTGPNLTNLYGFAVRVENIDGVRVVLATGASCRDLRAGVDAGS